MALKEPKSATVLWHDPYSSRGWMDIDHIPDDPGLECMSAGYVLRDDDKCIQLAQSITMKDGVVSTVSDVVTIPRHAIIKGRNK